ncbi:CPBP family intramembrane glutamic endopeptidase [Aurantiacibacter sp. D1-12]|uniref:CPBP family intramembrane glutamic endopeptidase n=1 Tax=Aurantiacibacter sp. D1-12 TaxID=2993658 RepID=UPI00237C7434|nr:type II CAAX endopeptidase family protein [Aurantiacibacter sp. D1-12]MDE1466354.1 type II CAAX endopeptidase family protein [Aurantiacibacter sp. D1-12]
MGAGDVEEVAQDKAVQAESRPIWRKVWEFPLVAMVVGVALMVGAIYLASTIMQLLVLPRVEAPWDDIIGAVLIVLISGLTYKLLVTRLGRKRHDDLPFDGRMLRDTLAGFGVGGLLISICVALAALFGAYTILGGDGFGDWPMIIFVFGLYAGFFEEVVTRGIILRWLEEFAGTWIALALSSLFFGFMHASNDNATFFSSLAISIEAGILLGAAYILTRSLWLAIGIHAGWNVVQALWDIPVSGNPTEGPVAATLEGHWLLAGGGFGLEATIFALVVATSAGIWMLWKAAKAGRIVKPMWSRKGEGITAY